MASSKMLRLNCDPNAYNEGKWLCYVEQYSFPRSRTSLRLRASVWIRFMLFRHSMSFLGHFLYDLAIQLRHWEKKLKAIYQTGLLRSVRSIKFCRAVTQLLHIRNGFLRENEIIYFYLYSKLLKIRLISNTSFLNIVSCYELKIHYVVPKL